MGMFQKRVKVSNIFDTSKFFEQDFWVDTGALYSFIPEDYAEKIGFEPISTKNIIYADGRLDRRLFGSLNFEIEGFEERIPCPVIIAPKNSLFLLGATALVNFCVEADPVNKRLNPILAIIANSVSII